MKIFKKILNEMVHIEDLKAAEFVDFVKNIYKSEASLKLDGSNALMFGFDSDGKFYTGFGRNFREVKQEKRNYDINNWYKDQHIKINPAVSAHKALLAKMNVIKQYLKPGEGATAEVLFGDKPNCIKYDFGGVNYLVILNNAELAKALKGKIKISVDNYIIDTDLVKKSIPQIWDFGETEKVDPSKFDIDINKELSELEKFLSAKTNGFENVDIIAQRAAGKNKELVKSIRERAQKLKLNVKAKLLDQFVRKIKGEVYKTAEGESHEGVVLKRGDKMTKIIDKEVFTKIHERDWEPVEAAKKIIKLVSKKEAASKINNLIRNFEEIYPEIKDPIMITRMKNNLRLTLRELK